MFFRLSIDKILSAVTRGISDLREVAEQHVRDHNEKNETAKALQAEADIHAAHADRAFTLAERFEKLISVEK